MARRPSRNWPAATSHKGVKAPHRRSRGAPTPEFLAKVPRQFRDSLPARGEQFAKRNVAPKALGEIAYTDVAAWLRTEPALRLPLLPLWKSRAADLTFRAAAKANLAQHPEWEPYADPEGYARRMAEEAERRRAREAARQAAAAAAAAGVGHSRRLEQTIVNRRASCRNSGTSDCQDWRLSCAFYLSSI